MLLNQLTELVKVDFTSFGHNYVLNNVVFAVEFFTYRVKVISDAIEWLIKSMVSEITVAISLIGVGFRVHSGKIAVDFWLNSFNLIHFKSRFDEDSQGFFHLKFVNK